MIRFIKQDNLPDYVEVETTLDRVMPLWMADPLGVGHVPGNVVYKNKIASILLVLKTKEEMDMPHFRFFSTGNLSWLEIEEGRHRLEAFRQLSLERIWVALHPLSNQGYQEALKP